MSDAMDLPKAEIVQIVSDWMQEYADALGVANDSDQIGLAIEELQADRDRLTARVEELEAELARTTEVMGDPATILELVEPGKWQVCEIVQRAAPMPRKAVYNAIGYLVRIGRAQRLSYGVVQIAARTLQPDGARL